MQKFLHFVKEHSYLTLFLALFFVIFIWSFYKIFSDNPKESIRKSVLSSQKIVLYSKKDCFFCKEVEKILNLYNLHYSIIDITNNPELHIALSKQTNQTTVPYIFVDNRFLGGWNELNKILQN
ncbi:MAG: glutaredoxin [Rickettsia sp.]|nr:glutaredoxin [Rickettsia sp.]